MCSCLNVAFFCRRLCAFAPSLIRYPFDSLGKAARWFCVSPGARSEFSIPHFTAVAQIYLWWRANAPHCRRKALSQSNMCSCKFRAFSMAIMISAVISLSHHGLFGYWNVLWNASIHTEIEQKTATNTTVLLPYVPRATLCWWRRTAPRDINHKVGIC